MPWIEGISVVARSTSPRVTADEGADSAGSSGHAERNGTTQSATGPRSSNRDYNLPSYSITILYKIAGDKGTKCDTLDLETVECAFNITLSAPKKI